MTICLLLDINDIRRYLTSSEILLFDKGFFPYTSKAHSFAMNGFVCGSFFYPAQNPVWLKKAEHLFETCKGCSLFVVAKDNPDNCQEFIKHNQQGLRFPPKQNVQAQKWKQLKTGNASAVSTFG